MREKKTPRVKNFPEHSTEMLTVLQWEMLPD
jgi:hypothetical protein